MTSTRGPSTPTRGPSTPTRGSRDVFGNIGLNDPRAHGSLDFPTKQTNKKLFGSVGGSKIQIVENVAMLVIHFQRAEIRRLRLQNAFLKLKYSPGQTKNQEHTTPKKRRYGTSEEETVERLGGITTNFFSSPTRVKSRDIPTTPPTSRQHSGVASRSKSAVPTPDRHVLHAKLTFPHDLKHHPISNPEGPFNVRVTSATPSSGAAVHISDGMIDDLSKRLRDLERHIYSLSVGEQSSLSEQHTIASKHKVAFQDFAAKNHAPRQRYGHGVTSHPDHCDNAMPSMSGNRPTTPLEFEKSASQPTHRISPLETTAPSAHLVFSTPSIDSGKGSDCFPISSGDTIGSQSCSRKSEDDLTPQPNPLEESDHDLHDSIQRASAAALQTIHFSRLSPHQQGLNHFQELSYASPDETLAAIRKGLASPPHISPLGQQSKSGIGTPTVPLSDLPLLQSKLSTWRKLYSSASPSTSKPNGISKYSFKTSNSEK